MAKQANEVVENTVKHADFGIPVIWGKRGAGKTLFSLNSPYKPVHIIDVENSSVDYELYATDLIKLGYFDTPFTRAFTPQWSDFVAEYERIIKLPDYSLGTLAIDTVGQVAEWVKTYEFTRPGANAEKMSQVVWGKVRDRLRNMLLMLSKKATTIILLAHEREYNHVFSPRCNPAVMELTSVSIRLIREPNVPLPDGIVTYSRLPYFPPRIPQVTMSKMLTYLEKPADWKKLKDEEKQRPEDVVSPIFPDEVVED